MAKCWCVFSHSWLPHTTVQSSTGIDTTIVFVYPHRGGGGGTCCCVVLSVEQRGLHHVTRIQAGAWICGIVAFNAIHETQDLSKILVPKGMNFSLYNSLLIQLNGGISAQTVNAANNRGRLDMGAQSGQFGLIQGSALLECSVDKNARDGDSRHGSHQLLHV